VLWLVLESGSSLVEMIYLGPEAILFVGQNPIHQNFGNPSPDLLIFILFKSSIIECLISCDSVCGSVNPNPSPALLVCKCCLLQGKIALLL
jgi:hypothetical protein